MIYTWIQLFCMLITIFLAAQIFTNALEHFGEKMLISEGAVGSIFAAVATALPETLVPILAIVAGTSNHEVNEEISVGAILGAPLMLSTLSTVLMTLSVIRQRGLRGRLKPEYAGFVRDINFFLMAFSLAAIALYVPAEPIYIRVIISLTLILLYIIYVALTFKQSKGLVQKGHLTVTDTPLYFSRIKLPNKMPIIVLQMFFGLILLLFGARGFIHAVEKISDALNISALLISLLIIPIATELPEKVNSILWVRKNKDTLGFGNITGAMVFQGSLLPAIGILLTPWEPSKEVLDVMFITFIASVWLRIIASKKGLPIYALLLNGVFYLLYLYLALGSSFY